MAGSESVGHYLVDFAGGVRGRSDGDGRKVERAVEPGVALAGITVVSQAGTKLDSVIAMAQRRDVLKLESDPVVFAHLAGETAANKIAATLTVRSVESG